MHYGSCFQVWSFSDVLQKRPAYGTKYTLFSNRFEVVTIPVCGCLTCVKANSISCVRYGLGVCYFERMFDCRFVCSKICPHFCSLACVPASFSLSCDILEVPYLCKKFKYYFQHLIRVYVYLICLSDRNLWLLLLLPANHDAWKYTLSFSVV